MFKLVAVFALFAVANAGIISHGHLGHAEIIAAPAHIAVAPIAHHGHATSYANHNSLSVHPVPVAVAHHAPAHIVHAAPAAHFVAAPIAHVGIAHGHGHHGYFH
ncbi:hypothetical protein RN001_009038 [Aquatica leii]|uniref:Uncharacterized protein n=1 Tax=Aquatica leii TaxID=1421715 RepID=A0AAN7PUZ1_9COLE|nr:hypothetical protein RN001_009038 [Aquatica leii]